MTTTKVVLRFPPELADQPVTYKLIKEYDLMVNILRGHIIPKEEGMLVLELTGTSSIHSFGQAAKKALEDLREKVAKILGSLFRPSITKHDLKLSRIG